MTSFSGTTPTDAVELQKLLSSDAAGSDFFGTSVALSSDGNTALIGAYLETTSPNSANGAAYVFTRSAGTWTQQQKLLASDAATGDNFGISVALSADGNTALIGAYLEKTSPYSNNGAVYVFTRSDSTWTQQQKLLASDRASNESFGYSVSLSADGNTALIGAYLEDTSPNTDNGAAYVFTRSGSTWTEQQKLLASDATGFYQFGFTVDLSSNGDTAIVGAMDAISENGAAYVFTRSGSTWTEQQKLLSSDLESGDRFGQNVSISSDGNTAIIGSAFEDTSPNLNNGAAYVFTRSGGTWTQQQKLLSSDGTGNDYFGASVALSSDGNTALIGAYLETTSPNSFNGAAYVFTRSGSTWTQQQKLLASDRASSDNFGISVALSADGNTALIGAYLEDTSPNSNNGAAYIYALGRTLDNKLYSYNSTKGAWDVSVFGELLAPATRIFTSSDTFVVPTGAKVVEVTCIGGGGGGGGGARNVFGDGGGSGGGGGGLSKYLFRVQDIGGVDASITVTVGTGGAGGAATALDTIALSGNNGVSGGTTSFGTFLYAYGGANGVGGTTSARTGGAGGFGMFSGNAGGNTSSNGAFTVSGAGGGGGGGATFGVGSISTAFNIANPSGSGAAGISNATLRSPGSGGNGRSSTTTTVSIAGVGGLYGGGGGGGGEGSTAGSTGAGGAGGAGASGACIIRVWYG
jgi:hypothetical protein